jgi:hypothetical protein
MHNENGYPLSNDPFYIVLNHKPLQERRDDIILCNCIFYVNAYCRLFPEQFFEKLFRALI